MMADGKLSAAERRGVEPPGAGGDSTVGGCALAYLAARARLDVLKPVGRRLRRCGAGGDQRASGAGLREVRDSSAVVTHPDTGAAQPYHLGGRIVDCPTNRKSGSPQTPAEFVLKNLMPCGAAPSTRRKIIIVASLMTS